MMIRINKDSYNYIVAIIPFLRSIFDIHSSINSIILCSMFIHWNTLEHYSYTLNTLYTRNIIMITIAYKGCVSIS